MHSTFTKLLAVAVVTFWALFLYVDHWWQVTVEQAVRDRQGTYSEIFGPLSFFRPVVLYSALGITLIATVALLRVGALSADKKEPPTR